MLFVCSSCAQALPMAPPRWRCDCGGYLDIHFHAAFPIDEIEYRAPGMWRYREAIPLPGPEIVSFHEGMTPLVDENFSGVPVYFKADYLFPSGSFKDRGSSVMISWLKQCGINKLVEDSSGNAGASVAAYASRAGIECEIYTPASASEGKLAQIRFFGAKLNKIPGTREDTTSAVMEATKSIYYASHTWNPMFFHGTKTVAYEICEQLGWKSPGAVVVPAGQGTLMLGVYLGFSDLQKAGVTDRMPRIIAVQSANCAPLYHAFLKKLDTTMPVQKKDTVAEGIANSAPVRGKQLLQAVRETGGEVMAVTEEEIMMALSDMCRRGFYIEPTSAVAAAGLRKKAADLINEGPVVAILSGNGLKATDKMRELLV